MHILVLLISLFIYLRCVAPTVTFSDSGDFITCCYNLGITHPNGYPLHTLIGRLIAVGLPFGNIGYRVNILSSLFTATASVIFYFVLYRLTKTKFIAFVGAFIFCLSTTLWKVSIIAEIYSLYCLFAVILIFLGILLTDSEDQKLLYLISYIFGLSLTNHTLSGLILPGLLYIGFKKLIRIKILIPSILLSILGLSVFFYLPIRSSHSPIIDWSNAKQPKEFIRHVTSAIYHEQMFGEKAKTQIQNILLFLKMLKNQFLYLFIFLPLGFYYLYKKQKNIFIFLSLILFFNLIAIFVYKIIPELTDHEAYFLPAYTVLALFISYGLFFIYKKLKSKTLHIIFYSVIIILILFFLKINYFYITMRNYFFAYDYGRNVFLQIPDNSILFNQVDYNVFPLWYLQYVEERRPDLCTFALLFLTRPWYVETLLKKYPYVKPPDNLYKFYKEVFFDLVNNNLDKNIYYTFSKDAEIEIPYQDNLKKIGILFKVLPSGSLQEEEKLFTFDYNYRSIFDKNIYKDIWAREVMLVYGYYYAYLGEELIRKNRIAEAISMLHKSLKFDNKNASYIAALASAYLINKDYNKALEYFKKAYEFQQSKDYLRNIVFCLHKLGKKDKAQEYLKQMKKISP